MRKVIVIVLILIMVFTSINVCYAATGSDDMQPFYVTVAYYNNAFNIDDEGIASYSLTISPNPLNTPDKVTATVKIINVASGSSVYTKTKTLSYSSTTRKFTTSDTKQLTNRGGYEMEVIYKCYDGDTLIETITSAPKIAIY